jgi:hypothetical protein
MSASARCLSLAFGNKTSNQGKHRDKMIKMPRMKKRLSILGGIGMLIALCVLAGVGCVSVVNLEYREHTQKLDQNSEIVISTHPAWFPNEEVHIPLLYIKLVTDGYVALQFNIRKRGTKSGSNQHIQSLQARNLAYRLDAGPEQILLTDYSSWAWSQETGNYAERTKKGIPYQEGSVLHVTADLTLNGKDHSIEAEMPARRRVRRYPSIIYYLGR